MWPRLPLRQRGWAVAIAAGLILLALILFGPRSYRSLSPSQDASDMASGSGEAVEPWLPSVEGEPGPEDLFELERVQQHVRPDAPAHLEARGGLVRLDLPAGTVSQPTIVELVRYRVDHPASLDEQAFDLQPDGLSLHRPVRFGVALPLGVQPDEVEIARYDPSSGRWRAEARQSPTDDGAFLEARLRHFSLRRLRVRPGMSFPRPERAGRATFYLESDAGNTFERYVQGRWRAVDRRGRSYRELMALGRVGRHELIASGRLRAITAPRPRREVFDDGRRTVAMPAGSPQARTGWVQIERLDASGEPTGPRVVARVNDIGPGPGPRAAGVVLDMSRATTEALGLRWGEDFGLSELNPDLAWMSVRDPASGRDLRYVPVRVRAYEAQPARREPCRLR
jgi:hypothetical protein